jgi:hypothetical protein
VIQEEDINKNENEEVTLKTGAGEVKINAKSKFEPRSFEMGKGIGRRKANERTGYALNVALPNFYFHHVTAYDILRAQGVQIGKRHYLGQE